MHLLSIFSFLAEVKCTVMSLKMCFSAWPDLHPKTQSEMWPSLTGWALRGISLTVWHFGWRYCRLLPEGKWDGLICITYFKQPNIIQICWILPVFSTHLFYFHDLVICKLLHVSQNVSYFLNFHLLYTDDFYWLPTLITWSMFFSVACSHINMSFLFYFWH